jgi:hypothetical protein
MRIRKVGFVHGVCDFCGQVRKLKMLKNTHYRICEECAIKNSDEHDEIKKEKKEKKDKK